MIRNIIFDMGNVLFRYDPEYFIRRAGVQDPADREMLLNAIFQSPEWPLLDKGIMTEADLAAHVRTYLPERLHEVACELIFRWTTPIEPIPGMADFVRECKHAGLGIYLLSNATGRQPEYWHEIPGSEYFDGVVISARTGFVKPMPEIYLHLLSAFGLNADECLFVDDMPENIAGAQNVGIHGVLFSGNIAALRESIFGKHP